MPDFFKGKKIVISAGPTQEKIDPVRFISNYSTGKMGYAIAESLAKRAADVHLVSGPVNLTIDRPEVRLYKVESALEMYEQCTTLFEFCDMAIMCAAVADYRPESVSESKIKKSGDRLTLTLVKNPDILSTLGSSKKSGQFVIGFALESENGEENAMAKLINKNADAIVLNTLSDEGAGFGFNTNKVRILFRNECIFDFGLKSKKEIAEEILNCLSENLPSAHE